MNLGELKAFLGQKTQIVDRSMSQQTETDHIRQAVGKQGSHVSLSSSSVFSLSSQSFIGARVYNNALNQNLVINEQKANLPSPKKEQDKGLFDFEEVAKNVLTFVGGALKNAKAKGMADEELTSMFEQARNGVLKGVKMAEHDLGGMMNNEISSGISKSRELIENGIQQLEQKLLGKESLNQLNSSQVSVSETINHTSQESGNLTIRTKDGDEVSISFENLQQFSVNQQLILDAQEKQRQQQQEAKQSQPQEQNELPTSPAKPETETAPAGNQQQISPELASAEEKVMQTPAAVQEPKNTQDENIEASLAVTQETNYLHYESSSFAFSVKGDLDEDELKAIGELVGDANRLADEFFRGDIESAYNQALELGYNDQELTGFAFQLTSFKQTEVIKTYEAVSHYNDKNEGRVDDSVSAVKPVADYLEHMLDVVEKANERLEDGSAFDNLVNGLINQMPDVHTPDLISAINRFNGFNKQLMHNLPSRMS
ncbi:DUF5610 domain-containing protein [Alteromonadaceae bacterium BrNp21-10]|nr:DUF5610 domain-containing protein [Alteromonadaceae bacterium BrNp21-10]